MLCHVLLHIGNLVMDLLLKTEGLFRQIASLNRAYTIVGWHGMCMAKLQISTAENKGTLLPCDRAFLLEACPR